MKKHMIFDCELIGLERPVFLVCCRVVETGRRYAFWLHNEADFDKFWKLLQGKQYTWVSFNGEKFDRPLIAAAMQGWNEHELKQLAQTIIEEELQSWETYRRFGIEFLEYDHIDLIEVAPGVMINLKTYAGRMGYPTMVDMPFHHDHDLSPEQLPVVRDYCFNDLGVTEALFKKLSDELELRRELSDEHGIDLRSKSDAQIAEAIMKKTLGIARMEREKPSLIKYKAPDIIHTTSVEINDLIEVLENTKFKINYANGQPIEADWMENPLRVGDGLYKFGLGGLHSQHDKNLYVEETDKMLVSDFDVGSYYPSIMLNCGIVPRLGGRGQQFMDAYREIYETRLEAKHTGLKKKANSLKIVLNGMFGKLGSQYSTFYDPALLIAVTITGQLNLLCVIDELERLKGVSVLSANTDGLMVKYPVNKRKQVLAVFQRNSKRTGFSYEETPYRKVAMKDVNNYIAIPSANEAVIIEGGKTKPYVHKMSPKGKGLYAEKGLMKNPTMQVCADAATQYLVDGTRPEDFIKACSKLEDFVAIRNVKGGGIQYNRYELVDDWEGGPKNWTYPGQTTKPKTTVKRPEPREVGVGGIPFGRVARWYMTTQELPPISYVGSGNRVPKTEGAKICMALPKKLPSDLDLKWYVEETENMLRLMGVTF